MHAQKEHTYISATAETEQTEFSFLPFTGQILKNFLNVENTY
jgi:hypothetical protein